MTIQRAGARTLMLIKGMLIGDFEKTEFEKEMKSEQANVRGYSDPSLCSGFQKKANCEIAATEC